MNKKANRALSILLALIMIVGLLPISAFAENDAPATGTDIAIENMDGKEEDTAKEGASPSDPGELPGSGEGKEQGDNQGGEDKTAESTPTPEPSKASAKQAAPAQGDPSEEQPQPASYTLTLKAEPDEGGTVTDGGSYPEGTEVTVKATANDGYVFTGWYVEPEEQRDAEERRDEDRRSEDAEYTFTLNADLTLCAVFTQQQPDEQTPATPTDGEPGENTDDEPGDTGDGAAGGKQEAPAGETFTVNFDANGHGEAPEAVSVESGKSITAPEAPEAEGFVFTGWYSEAICETLWDFDADTVSADLTLYAGWEEAPALALRGMSAAPALRDGAKGGSGDLIGGIPPANGGYVYVNGIKWRVLGMSDTAWLLQSADALGGQMYWEDAMAHCNMVYNAFSAPEKAAVLPTNKDSGFEHHIHHLLFNFNVPDGNDLSVFDYGLENENLFLLSLSEAAKYFNIVDRTSRIGQEHWWLRSSWQAVEFPAGGMPYRNYYAGVVREGFLDLSCYYSYTWYVGQNFCQPAFQLSLAPILFTSPAEGEKSTATAGSGAFGTLNDPAGNAKLTLLDENRPAVTASIGDAGSAAVLPGGSLSVSYSGVTSGDALSALILDENGKALYYASTSPDASGSGTWDMTLPDDLSFGKSYTLRLFSEQLNGDFNTDYAGAPCDLTLTTPDPYPLWIGDTQVNPRNKDNILGAIDPATNEPTASYDPATKTLTLHNPTISGAHDRARIYSEDSLTISGELTIGSSDRGVAVYTRGDGALNTLTIAAGSSIAITSDNEAIYAERANVHIKGGTLTAASGYRAVNIKYRGNFIMDGGDVSLSAPNIALIAWKGGSSQTPYSGEHCITVGGGVIRAYSETEDPFLAGDGVISYPANYRAVDAENNVLTLGSNQSSFGVKGTTITIEPAPVSKPVNVTVTGKTASEDYDGTEKSVSGFGFTAKDSDDGDVSGITVTLKSAYAGAASIAKTDAGDYDMGLQAEYFEITLPDGYTLGTVTVNDGKLSIVPYKLVVEISGKQETKPFNNAEQSVTGFTVALQGTLPAPMQYTEADVDDNGSAVAKGTQPGTYPMGLDASKFTNKNKNFDVMFIVAQDGQLVIEPAQPTGQVEADPVSLSFGSVQQGYTSITPKPVTIRNNTAASVTISALGGLTAFEATAMDASAQPVTLPYTLPAGESINLAVHPKSDLAANDYSETLTVAYNDGTDQTLSVALSFTVTGTQPQPTTKHTVTYIVVNGTWADGTNGPKTEEVEDGQSPTQIPTGMVASEGFEGGAWSPDPTIATITGDTTFTYTFDVKNLDVVGIVNWNDDNNEQHRPEKITVRLMANGAEQASQEVKAGSSGLWTFSFDNRPAADAQGDIDYTITVDEIPEYTTKVEKVSGTQFVITNTLNGTVKPTHTVTYIVVNGTWADGTNGPKTEEVEDGQSPTQIPTGMIASEGFEGGAWSPDPTSATITDTASFTYTFTAKQNPPGPVTVTGIKLNSNGAKKVYTEGETLDVTGLTLEVSKSDGSKSTVDVTAAMISGFDSSKTGTQTLTVRYEGFTATYEVEVKAKTNPPVTTSTISYNLNGGTLNGKTGTVTIQAENGTTITLPAPTREGYTFDYWEGSRYNAGDSYTVNGDHTFTAQWKKNSTTPGTSDPGKTSPKTGDESNLALWSSLMFLSVAAMIVLLLYARKRKTEK